MEIQPQTFGSSLSELIRLLGKVWRSLLLPALVTSVVVAAASYWILTSTGAIDFIELTFANPEALETMSDEEIFDLFSKFFAGFAWVSVVSAALYGFLYLATALAVRNELTDDTIDTNIASQALALLVPWVVALFFTWLGTAAGFILLVLPGIWFAISMSMVAPVLAIENMGPLAAMRRSFRLVRGNWWETLGFVLLVGLIGVTASQLVQVLAIPALLFGSGGIAFGLSIVLTVAVQGLIIAAIAVGITVWYLNLRARADGPFHLDPVS